MRVLGRGETPARWRNGEVAHEGAEELGREGLKGQLGRWEVGKSSFALCPEECGLHLWSKGKPVGLRRFGVFCTSVQSEGCVGGTSL